MSELENDENFINDQRKLILALSILENNILFLEERMDDLCVMTGKLEDRLSKFEELLDGVKMQADRLSGYED